ncbi:MAG: hypothetical protein AAF798_05975 [Bacteroidota bacterium]
MEEFQQRFLEEWWPKAKELAASLSMEHWIVIGVTFLLLLIVPRLFRRRKGKPARAKGKKALPEAPTFELRAFQVAPLGKDANFVIRNTGKKGTLSTLVVKGRSDILVRNVVAGHEMEQHKEYGVLLEVNSLDQIRPDFWLELTYLDEHKNVYVQQFDLARSEAQKPRLVRKA